MERKKKISTNNFFSDGHLNKQTIAFCSEALFLGKIELVDEEIKKHLEECHLCKEEVFGVYEEINSNETLKSQLIKNAENLHNYTKPKLNINALLKIAALLIIFIGIGILYYFYFAKSDDTIVSNNTSVFKDDSLNQGEYKSKVDSAMISYEKDDFRSKENIQQNSDNGALAMNMKESDFFENLISITLRSEEEIKVVKPEMNYEYKSGEEIKFFIKRSPLDPIELSVYKNTGERIIRLDSLTTDQIIVPALGKGLYYWKIRKNGDMVKVGKFYVK